MVYKLALVSPPLRATSRKLPLSLLNLAGYVDKYCENAKTKLIDVKTKPYFKLSEKDFQEVKNKIINEIIRYNPEMVGFTVLFSDVKDVIELARKIKEKLPKTVVVGGWVHASYRPDELLNNGFDYVVIGEGEQTLKELVDLHSKNNDKLNEKQIRSIKGLAYFKNKTVIETGFRELIADLDEIPMIPYDKLNLKFYFKPELTHIYYFLLSSSSLMTTRGCPSRCTFCTGKDLWEKTCGSNIIRSFSVKRIVDEIEVLIKKFKIDAIFFHDQSFTHDKEKVKKICLEILKRKIKFVWQCQTKAFMIDDSLVKLMKKAGCIQIAFGFESGSQEALNRMKKGITVEQIRKAVEICNKNN
ncbi:MAG: radical SAM protein, partial [Candidatus Pacearchaeota archaeon]|nr:radical SAM protein [Candidatus Pacearchaeota archaeon]